jgi:hypothetical protein
MGVGEHRAQVLPGFYPSVELRRNEAGPLSDQSPAASLPPAGTLVRLSLNKARTFSRLFSLHGLLSNWDASSGCGKQEQECTRTVQKAKGFAP